MAAELVPASSLALCIHPAAASEAVLACAAFFCCPDRGGNPEDFDFSGGLVSRVVDLVFTGVGLGVGLLSTGEGLAACLLST